MAGPVPLTGRVIRRFAAPTGPYGSGHRGIDIATAAGVPVRAPGAGTVAFAGSVAGRGVLVLDHPSGLRTTLEPVVALAPAGTAVAAGEVIGQVAAGGHCDGCVHWGVRRGEVYLDPLALLSRRAVLVPWTSTGASPAVRPDRGGASGGDTQPVVPAWRPGRQGVVQAVRRRSPSGSAAA